VYDPQPSTVNQADKRKSCWYSWTVLLLIGNESDCATGRQQPTRKDILFLAFFWTDSRPVKSWKEAKRIVGSSNYAFLIFSGSTRKMAMLLYLPRKRWCNSTWHPSDQPSSCSCQKTRRWRTTLCQPQQSQCIVQSSTLHTTRIGESRLVVKKRRSDMMTVIILNARVAFGTPLALMSSMFSMFSL
jgi:hypothetical protein